jgi:hypothetical protein
MEALSKAAKILVRDALHRDLTVGIADSRSGRGHDLAPLRGRHGGMIGPLMPRRLSEGDFYGPAMGDPAHEGSATQTKNLSPFRNRPLGPLPFEVVARSPIVGLFAHRCPTTVAGLIALVVVDTIQSVARAGALAHIGEEVLEAVPALADGDSSAAVIGIIGMSRIVATSAHIGPDFILWRAVLAVGWLESHDSISPAGKRAGELVTGSPAGAVGGTARSCRPWGAAEIMRSSPRDR